MTLEEMKKVDCKTVVKEDLVDMREINIPETNSVEELLNYLLNNNINWYVHRRGILWFRINIRMEKVSMISLALWFLQPDNNRTLWACNTLSITRLILV